MILQRVYIPIFNFIFSFTRRVPEEQRNIIITVCCSFFAFLYVFAAGLGLFNEGSREAICTLVLAALIVFSVNDKVKKINWDIVIYVPFVLFGVSILLIGMFIHPMGDGFVIFALNLIIGFPCLYFVWINRGDYFVLFDRIALSFACMGFAYCIFCFYLAYNGDCQIMYGRMAAVAGNPNIFAKIGLAEVICSAYLLYRNEKNTLGQVLLAVVMGSGFGVIFEATSRGEFLSAIAVVIVLIAFFIKTKKIKIRNIAIIFITVVITTNCFMILDNVQREKMSDPQTNENITVTKMFSRFEVKGETPAKDNMNDLSSGRIDIWKLYVQNFNLFGNDIKQVFNGNVNSKEEADIQVSDRIRAHNNILEYLFRCGAFGLLYVMFFMGIGIKALIAIFQKRITEPFALLAIMAVAMFAIFSLLETAYLSFYNLPTCIFYLTIAPLFDKYFIARNEKQTQDKEYR